MNHLLYVTLGWLLGLLSPRLIDGIQVPYRRKRFKQAFVVELQDLRAKMGMAAFLVSGRGGLLNRAFIDWLVPIMTKYKGHHADPRLIEGLKSLAKLPNDQIRAGFAKMGGTTLTFKTYRLSFLENNLEALQLFPVPLQRRIFEIMGSLNAINEEIKRAWFYEGKTFDSSLSPENHAKVRSNIDQSYRTIGLESRVICDLVDQVFSEWEVAE